MMIVRLERIIRFVAILWIANVLVGCGGGSSVSGEQDAQQDLGEIDARFSVPSSGPLNTVYECQRVNSGLLYYLYLRPDGSLDWRFEVDTGQVFMFDGIYDFTNGSIHLQITDPGFALDEEIAVTSGHLGIVYRLDSPSMSCGAVGHGYDEQIAVATRHYQCPTVSQGAGSDVENAIELGASGVGGAIFRQRDTYPTGSIDPIIQRGYGIYRRVGDTIYGYFGQSFDDFNVITAILVNGDLQLQVEGMGSAGICDLR